MLTIELFTLNGGHGAGEGAEHYIQGNRDYFG